jgi:plastocyanin
VSCKLARLVLATSVAAGFALALTEGAGAIGHGIDMTSDDASKCDTKYGPPCFAPGNGTVTEVDLGDTVTWSVKDGTHTVTPVDPKAFDGSEDLKGPDGSFSVTFDKPGLYTYYCTHHGSVEKDGKTHHGMWGKIDVAEAGATTTTTTPEAATPPPTEVTPATDPPPLVGPPAAGSVADEAPPSVAPPTTASTAKVEKGKKKKDKEAATTTTQAAAVPLPPLTLDSGSPAPALPGDPSTAPPPPTPPAPPQGNAVALFDQKPAPRGKRILIATGLAIAALGIGAAGWRFAHRPGKYWPA